MIKRLRSSHLVINGIIVAFAIMQLNCIDQAEKRFHGDVGEPVCPSVGGVHFWFTPIEHLGGQWDIEEWKCRRELREMLGIEIIGTNYRRVELEGVVSGVCEIVRDLKSKQILICSNVKVLQLKTMVESAFQYWMVEYLGGGTVEQSGRVVWLGYILAMIQYYSREYNQSLNSIDQIISPYTLCNTQGNVSCSPIKLAKIHLALAGAQAAILAGLFQRAIDYSLMFETAFTLDEQAALGYFQAESLVGLHKEKEACEVLSKCRSCDLAWGVRRIELSANPCNVIEEKFNNMNCDE